MNGAEVFELAILAGGAGTRLRSRTGDLPKALTPVGGRPLIEHQLDLCRRHGFVRILLLLHHGADALRAHVRDGAHLGVTVGYSEEESPRGTAGALVDALPQLADSFLALYGDTYLDVNLRALKDAHAARAADATVFVHPNDHPHDSDLVEVDARGWIRRIHPYPHPGDLIVPNRVTAALFALRRDAFANAIAADTHIDLVKHALPAMIAAGMRVGAYRSPEYIKDMGTPERLDQVETDVEAGIPDRLSDRTPRSAVFLDRDGTMNREVSYITSPRQLELLPGVDHAVRRLNRSGRLAIVITNQSVVARGDVTFGGLERIHAHLEQLLGAMGAYVDGLYLCPHHPDSGFPGEVGELKVACECRKPGTQLIELARRDFMVGVADSWMVGDTTVDVETGRRAGLRTILVRSGHAGQDGRYAFRPDYVVADLPAAVDWILDGHPAMSKRIAPVAAAATSARLVLIGGLASSGKSSAARVLSELAGSGGRRAHVLPLDSWLKPQGERAEGTGVVSRYDLDGAVAAVQSLVDVTSPVTLDVPVYDRARRAHYPQRLEMTIEPQDLVILEGVPALLDDRLDALAQIHVHMEMPETERVARIRSDYRWRGAPDAHVNALLASRAIDETTAVQGAAARADFIIPSWVGR